MDLINKLTDFLDTGFEELSFYLNSKTLALVVAVVFLVIGVTIVTVAVYGLCSLVERVFLRKKRERELRNRVVTMLEDEYNVSLPDSVEVVVNDKKAKKGKSVSSMAGKGASLSLGFPRLLRRGLQDPYSYIMFRGVQLVVDNPFDAYALAAEFRDNGMNIPLCAEELASLSEEYETITGALAAISKEALEGAEDGDEGGEDAKSAEGAEGAEGSASGIQAESQTGGAQAGGTAAAIQLGMAAAAKQGNVARITSNRVYDKIEQTLGDTSLSETGKIRKLTHGRVLTDLELKSLYSDPFRKYTIDQLRNRVFIEDYPIKKG